jgi:hypothetical protein
MDKIIVNVPGVRDKFQTWINNRGGVQVWKNINLSNPDAGNTFTPALKIREGEETIPYPQPHWSMERGEVITDINRFKFVKAFKEVKRFHVAIRVSGNGLTLKCTDASTRRIRAACDKFPGSVYRFDYDTQECVIEIPEY